MLVYQLVDYMQMSGMVYSQRSVIREVRLPGRQSLFDILVGEDGLVAGVVAHDTAEQVSGSIIDGNGALALPAFVDGHVHLDKTFLGIGWISHLGHDGVAERIQAEKELRRTHSNSLSLRAETLMSQMLRCGTTALRTHVDIDEVCRLSGLDVILALKEKYQDVIDMQVVAFPQSGLRGPPNVVEDLKAALEAGANAVGGLDPTTIDGDLEGSLDTTFKLAADHNACVDFHLHEPGEVGAAAIEGICRRTVGLQLQGRVVVSHGFCLADVPPPRLAALADAMAAAGVSLMTSAPGPGKLVPITDLRARGVRVFTGSDNIRDAWAPSGNGDMLDRARLLAYRADFRTDELLGFAFDCATNLPAEILGFAPRGPSVGSQADIVLLASSTLEEAVCDVPRRRRVIRKGRVIAG